MEFSRGQAVTIKHNLKYGYHYDAFLTSDMCRYAGCSTTVVGVLPNGSMSLEIDNRQYNWSPDMLEGYTGFYIGNHVLADGIEKVIVNSETVTQPTKRYQCRDGCWYTESQLERIDGFDYSNQTPPDVLNVGDYVIVDINPNVKYYGGNSDWACSNRYDRLMNNGLVCRIVKIDTPASYYVLDIDDSVCYSGYMLKKIVTKSPRSVGDVVLCDGNVGVIKSIADDTYHVSFKTNEADVSTRSVLELETKDIKLRRNVFGVGKSGDIITGYHSKDLNRYFALSDDFMSGELFDDEFSLV